MDRRIKQEQIRILYSTPYSIFSGALAVLVITTLALWPISDKPLLALWAGVSIVVILTRLIISRHYLSLSIAEQNNDYNKWGNLFIAFSLSNGIVWGLLPVILYPEITVYFSLIVCVHAGYISASSNMTAIYLPTCLAFVLPSTFLFAIASIFNGGLDYWPYSALICVFGIATAVSAARNNRSITEQIILRFQNTELLKDLTVQRDNAEKAMLAKNRFLAAASHDLRQPVHALGLFVDSLSPYLEAPKAVQILEKIKQSSTTLGGLFHGLLDLSKLDANVIENNPRDFRLDELLHRLKTDCSEAAIQKHITLNIPTNSGYAVYADLALLERIMRNIIENAIKYTDAGSVSLEYNLDNNNNLKIDIIDTGRGIPESEFDNIFSEYHQLENSERDREKGLGLGLAIVRRLGLLTNIKIEVKSSINTGSVFSIVMPLGDANNIDSPKPITKPAKLEELRVVVIDDEIDIIEGMQNVLWSWGCSTFVGTTTVEAMLALEGQDMPDLIIADFRLKAGESGLDAIQTIRDEYNHDIPAALITGDTAPERIKQAMSASAILMHKPVEPEKLRTLLAELTAAEGNSKNQQYSALGHSA